MHDSQVIRFIEDVSVAGATPARRAEIMSNASKEIERAQMASIEWRGKDQFIFRNDQGMTATYTRVRGTG